jgi:hypothetical protein
MIALSGWLIRFHAEAGDVTVTMVDRGVVLMSV